LFIMIVITVVHFGYAWPILLSGVVQIDIVAMWLGGLYYDM